MLLVGTPQPPAAGIKINQNPVMLSVIDVLVDSTEKGESIVFDT